MNPSQRPLPASKRQLNARNKRGYLAFAAAAWLEKEQNLKPTERFRAARRSSLTSQALSGLDRHGYGPAQNKEMKTSLLSTKIGASRMPILRMRKKARKIQKAKKKKTIKRRKLRREQ